MDFRSRRYVWMIDLAGMLAGAALAGHLVAKQIVGALSPPQIRTERSRAPSSPGVRPGGSPPTSAYAPVKLHARSCSSVSPRALGVHHYEISRAFVDHLLGRLAELPKTTHIIPETGEPIGLRIVGDFNGLIGVVGLASGDLLLELNGFALTHPSAALEAYASLRGMNEPWLVIQRGGRRILLTYRIVDDGACLTGQPLWSARQAASNSSCEP